MADLDSPAAIKKLDSRNLASSIEQLDNQCEQVFGEIEKLALSPDFAKAEKIVVCGMGGSALGADVLKSLYFNELKVPLEIINGYFLPSHANDKTLVIFSSYSGTTEEVLTAVEQAKEKGTMIMTIASGGDLAKMVQAGEVEGYIFDPKYNPSGQPRMGLGYSILSQVLILAKLGFLKFSQDDLNKILVAIRKANSLSNIDVLTGQNSAKHIAQKFAGKIPFLFASEHLVGNIHVFANQINENAKVLSAYFTLPEANHHLIEGLPSTDAIQKQVVFFFLKSNLYSPRVLKRYDITKTLVSKNGFEAVVFEPQFTTKLEQVFEFLTFGSWVSFYLAIVYDRDPSPIPNVDFLKNELSKE